MMESLVSYIGIGLVIVWGGMITSKKLTEKTVQLCAFIVKGVRGTVKITEFNLKRVSVWWLMGLFTGNMGYLIYLIGTSFNITMVSFWGYSVMSLFFLYLALFYRYKRISFVVLMIPLVVTVIPVLLSTDYVFSLLNFFVLGMNIAMIIWLGLASFNKLLLRFWTVYDMLILFSCFIAIVWQWSRLSFIWILYFVTIYILSKVVFDCLERSQESL